MKISLVSFLLILFLPFAAFADEAEIGMIKTMKGKASVVTGSTHSPAAVGTVVHQNDGLETGPDGAIGVTFVDNTTLSPGPNSQITLTKYVFDPRGNNFAFVTDMAKGSLMYVSGLIAKLSPEAVSMHTPVGTVGVRGTRFLLDVGQ